MVTSAEEELVAPDHRGEPPAPIMAAGSLRSTVAGVVSAESAPAVAAAQDCSATESRGAGTDGVYVYALGRIEPRFPTLEVEKEFAQVTGRAETAGLSDRAVVQRILLERQNRYLARSLCWVFSIERIDTYILRPVDPSDMDMFVEAVRPTPDPSDVDCIIGV